MNNKHTATSRQFFQTLTICICLLFAGTYSAKASDRDHRQYDYVLILNSYNLSLIHIWIYYSIQLWVVEIAAKQNGTTLKPVIGRFEHEENGNVRMRDFKGRKDTSDEMCIRDSSHYSNNI